MMNVHAKEWPWPTAPVLPKREVDPIVLQIVEGTLNSIEAEIEYAIERTARSPMIREAHDYRVGLFDRYCRKLTGRSYSAMPNAVVRDFPPETMRPGDVFLMNDTYLTEGSIGHLPDLCSTVPVFHDGEVVAYIQAFGHHDDIGGRVPGSMPGTATTVFEEGLAVPPVKFYVAGVRNDAVFTIVKRNTRVPETLAADLDSEVQACLMGARRMAELFARLGRETVEACFQAILDTCRDTFRDELLPKIADGEYRWEDYVEHDGVTDPKLHKLALTLIKKGDRITLDFFGDQLVCHLSESTAVPVAPASLYPRHFGVTFRAAEDFGALHELAVTRKIPFFAERTTRFDGLVEVHQTFVLVDPSGNLLEFKHYADPRMMY